MPSETVPSETVPSETVPSVSGALYHSRQQYGDITTNRKSRLERQYREVGCRRVVETLARLIPLWLHLGREWWTVDFVD